MVEERRPKSRDGSTYHGSTVQNPIHQVLAGKAIKNDSDPICRLCEKYVETIGHLVFGCPILTAKESKDRHRFGQYINWKICQYYSASHIENKKI